MSIRVTVEDTETGETETTEITNTYLLITEGTAYHHGVTLHRLKDGTQTHVITVKGCRS